MKDVFQLFDEYFPILITSLEQFNFQSCASISSDLIKLSEMVDYNDGIFIGEIFEATFSQINMEFMRYEISVGDKEGIKALLLKDISTVFGSYKDEDKYNLFNALKELRADATKFQFRIRSQCRVLPQPLQFPMSFVR